MRSGGQCGQWGRCWRQQWEVHCAAVLLVGQATGHPPLRNPKSQRLEFPKPLKCTDGEEVHEIEEIELERGTRVICGEDMVA